MRADFELNAAEQAVERDLLRYYAAGDPAPAFVARLEQQLAAQATTSPLPRRTPGFLGRWLAAPRPLRWAAVACALLLIVAVTVGALGPQRVWAEVQRLFGYVPGIGFVEADKARLLAEPVAETRDGLTLRLAQVVARNDETVVSLTVDGLPQRAQLERDRPALEASLELPHGRSLALIRSSYGWGEAQLHFPALPAEVVSATLALPRLPLAAAGQLPEGWRLPFTLRSAAGAVAANVFPRAYEPTGAEATHNGVTLRVLRVAHSAETTAIELEARWENRAFRLSSLGDRSLPALTDDLGHIYGEAPALRNTGGAAITKEGAVTTVEQVTVVQVPRDAPSMLPPPGMATRTLTFSPASAAARTLRLDVNAVSFMADFPDESHPTPFILDLGDAPQIGQRWALDEWLDVQGFRVHLTGAHLEQSTVMHTGDPGRDQASERPAFLLRFDVDPLPEQADMRLESVCISPQPGAPQLDYGSQCGDDKQAPGIMFAEMPSGQLALQAAASEVIVAGPWELAWEVPAGAVELPPAEGPRTMRPDNAIASANSLTLRLQEAVLTDRVTALAFELAGKPGVELYRVPSRLSHQGLPEVGMRDDQGRDYRFAEGIGWGPYGGLVRRPNTLYLEPLAAPAATLQVELPTVEVRVPVHTSFDVLVPAGLKAHRHDGLARPAGSAPPETTFDLDVPLELGVYDLRFKRAWVGPGNDGGVLILEEASPNLGHGRRVAGYCIAGVTGPNGQPVKPGTGILPVQACDFGLGFAVGDPVTGVVEPGTYHVELEALIVAVTGPWQLSWDVRP